MTKPLDPKRLETRKMIRDARACGYELERMWKDEDGRTVLGFKPIGTATDEPVEPETEIIL
jgi:hypothetical protein